MDFSNRLKHHSFSCLVALLAGAPWLAHADDAGRVIVKYRSGSTITAQSEASGRMQALSARTGMTIQAERRLTDRVHVVEARGLDSAQLAARLAAQSDVEYAVPDLRRQALAVPNDSLYQSQWYLLPNSTATPAAINAQTAWDVTTGSANVVVAVIDTGIRADHPDLAGKILLNTDGTPYGYDFVSNQYMANDGGGRDSDPSDPGDYLTSTDLSAHADVFKGCSTSNSSWHGTMVAGIVGAATNNSTGVSGVSWASQILPVRALGKCGGYDSDILAAMYWAAGIAVDGAPANAHPAKILNLSLGGAGTCNAAYKEAISQITAAGASIVVAAGNSDGAIGVPGNCPGVMTVAGSRHTGTKAGYSSYGAEAGIAAPAGNCGSGSSCQYSFITTTNSGTQGPGTHIYTDTTSHVAYGTSFATPLVSGTASLMLAVHPALTPASIMTRLKKSATAFPTDNALPSCTSGSTLVQCNCTTATCGAGLLNTSAAVNDALRPQAQISANGAVESGTYVTVSASGSTAATGRSIATYAWTASANDNIAGAISGADQANATIPMTGSGVVTVSLTVTDSQGATDTTSFAVTVGSGTSGTSSSSTASSSSSTASSTSGGNGGGGGGGGSVDLGLLAILAVLLGVGYAARARQPR
ncbi:MAG: S8 family serine peptidase [Rhodocyclaceae bacterium]